MTLIVKVIINDRCVIHAWAQRIEGQPHELCTYRLEDDSLLTHHDDDGVAAFARKVLTAYEQRVRHHGDDVDVNVETI